MNGPFLRPLAPNCVPKFFLCTEDLLEIGTQIPPGYEVCAKLINDRSKEKDVCKVT